MNILANSSETIAAIASAPGHSIYGLIRIGGADTLSVLHRVFGSTDVTCSDVDPALEDKSGSNGPTQSFPQRASRQTGRFRFVGGLWVAGSVYVWPTNRSYTGQPMAELHLPGSPALLEMALESVYANGARPAQRGEFTLRSFLAGRIDLAQAEAVLGVIDAFDHEELDVALRQLAGGLSSQIHKLRSALIEVLADVEAGLDFVDEDIEFIELPKLLKQLAQCRETVVRLYEQASDRMQSTGRLRVVLAGLPNAGKSTLFNCLTQVESALVSDEVGTTRDYLHATVQIEGLEIELIDTAGWEQPLSTTLNAASVDQNAVWSDDDNTQIVQQAQAFRQGQVAHADLIIWCSAIDRNLDEQRIEQSQIDSLASHRILRVFTKADLDRSDSDNLMQTAEEQRPAHGLAISAVDNSGIAELQQSIVRALTAERHGQRELVGSTAARSRDSLRRASESLSKCIETATMQLGDEFVSLEIREVLKHLGEIVGAVYTDDVLDRVFSRFCIGK